MKFASLCAGGALTRADIRRQKLVETARKLFIENGFHATGIAQIAQQSGIAVGQIYRDFSSKEDIVAALVTEDCERFMAADALQAAIAANDKASVLAWLQHFVEPSDDVEGDRMFAEIVAEAARNPRIAAIFTTLQDKLRGDVLRAIALLVPNSTETEASAVIADTILTFSIGLLNHRLFRPDLEIAPIVRALQSIISDQIDTLGRTSFGLIGEKVREYGPGRTC